MLNCHPLFLWGWPIHHVTSSYFFSFVFRLYLISHSIPPYFFIFNFYFFFHLHSFSFFFFFLISSLFFIIYFMFVIVFLFSPLYFSFSTFSYSTYIIIAKITGNLKEYYCLIKFLIKFNFH